jgi:hypothetical protein
VGRAGLDLQRPEPGPVPGRGGALGAGRRAAGRRLLRYRPRAHRAAGEPVRPGFTRLSRSVHGPSVRSGLSFATGGGLLVGGTTIEALTLGENTAAAQATLTGANITPVSATLFLDVDGLLLGLDPQGRFFSHDKLEGVAVLDGGRQLVISNDSDFGISGVTNQAPPWQLQGKISPATGQQDDGEYLVIDTGRLPAATSTATVTIHVSG